MQKLNATESDFRKIKKILYSKGLECGFGRSKIDVEELWDLETGRRLDMSLMGAFFDDVCLYLIGNPHPEKRWNYSSPKIDFYMLRNIYSKILANSENKIDALTKLLALFESTPHESAKHANCWIINKEFTKSELGLFCAGRELETLPKAEFENIKKESDAEKLKGRDKGDVYMLKRNLKRNNGVFYKI